MNSSSKFSHSFPITGHNRDEMDLPLFTSREELLSYIQSICSRNSPDKISSQLYQRIPFPGYEQSGMWRDDSEARLKAIAQAVPLKGMNVLDVGCNLGYFSFKLAELGATVWGIDHDPEAITIARSLAHIHGVKNVNFMLGKMDEATLYRIIEQAGKIDVILLLSVVHWLFLDAQDIRKVAWMINRLSHPDPQWLVYEPSSASGAYNPELITRSGVNEFFNKVGAMEYKRIGRFGGPGRYVHRELWLGKKDFTTLCDLLPSCTEYAKAHRNENGVFHNHRSGNILYMLDQFFVKTHLPDRPESRVFLANEADKLNALGSSIRNIPLFYGLYEGQDRSYIVYERLPFRPLVYTPVSKHDLSWIADEISQIVAALDSAGIVHNDINENNLLCDKTNRRLYLTDFEFATRPYDRDKRKIAEVFCEDLMPATKAELGLVKQRIKSFESFNPSWGASAARSSTDREHGKELMNSIRRRAYRWAWNSETVERIISGLKRRASRLMRSGDAE